MRKSLIVVIALALSLPMWGQQAKSAAGQPSKEEVMSLIKAMRVESQMTLMLQGMGEAMKKGAREGFLRKVPNATPKQLAALDDMTATAFQEFSPAELIAELVPVYQRNLTRDEINAMLTFYNSPTGQRILDKLPQISQEAMQVGMNYAQTKMESAMKRIDEKSKALVEASREAQEKK